MVQNIQIDRCFVFYLVAESSIDSFESFASYNAHNLQSYIPEPFSKLNIYTAVCNAWFALKSITEPIFLDESRRMQNASAYMQLELIESSKLLKHMMLHKKMSEQQLFINAFFISINSMQWQMDLMNNQNEKHILEPFLLMDGIAAINNQNFDDPKFQQTLQIQKKLQYEMMQSLTKSDSLVLAFQTALHQARSFLMKHPIDERGCSK